MSQSVGNQVRSRLRFPFGFGTYRVREGAPLQAQALAQALKHGVQLIDTSANYGDGSSERMLGDFFSVEPALRQSVILVTKAGYVQGENLRIAREREDEGGPFPELTWLDEHLGHCISPEFLADQLDRSIERLQGTRPDLLLLHNPEYFLKAGGSHEEYYRRIHDAFEQLEDECDRGRINAYGVSSNTFGDPKEAAGFTSLEVVCSIAEEISEKRGKPHRFAMVQFPLNIYEPGAVLEPNNAGKSAATFAREKGLVTLVNRPLNAFHGHQLIRLADFAEHRTGNFQSRLEQALGPVVDLESKYPAQDALPAREFAWGHAIRANFARIPDVVAWREALHGNIQPKLEVSLPRLEEDKRYAEWAASYRAATDVLFSTVSAYFEDGASYRSRHLHQVLDDLLPELKSSATLSQKALRLYRSLPGIDCVLVGMRDPGYVEDVLAAAAAPAIDSGRAMAALEAFAVQHVHS